ncbi:MAG TPA: FGGY-family carbohydrate kinase [Syntrophales bacterium]|nr:FGGY-family carbohydrate kinase [Syntrophales bacterium]
MSVSRGKHVLAIDLGTSGSKTALATIFGEIIDFEFQEVPLHLLPNGGAEQDPDDWWNAIISTTKKLLSKSEVPPEDIVAISCSTQWSGTVAVDNEGNHLMNAVIWMDSRGAGCIDRVRKGSINFEGYGIGKLLTWLYKTGGAPGPSGKDPISHILYIRKEYPEIFRKTYKFLEPKDYVNLRFTGMFAASYDSITLHWVTNNRDISHITYDDALLKIVGLERDKLPDLKRAIDILGPVKKEVAQELGIRENVQVIMGSPDVPVAAIGSGAVRDYEGHCYIGTSSWISAHIPFKKTDILHSIASLPSAIPDRYFIANEQEIAGGILNWLRDNIIYHKDELLLEENVPDVFKIFDSIAEKVPAGSNRVICTPWLYGERTPVENHLIRGGLHNISLATTREDIVRATFEGVAFNQKWVLKYIEKFIGQKMDPINMVGGGAISNIWCQIHADILDRTIQQMEDPIQTNARGSAFLASVALGHITFDDIPNYVKIKNVFTPNPDNRKIYDELFNEFLCIYRHNRGMCARLNRHC